MATKKRKPTDVNEIARNVIAQATGEEPEAENEEPAKDPAAVALGRKGGLKGGKARAKALTKKQRSDAAKIAAAARWKKSAPKKKR